MEISKAQELVKIYNTSHRFDSMNPLLKVLFQIVEGHEALTDIFILIGGWLDMQDRTAKLADHIKKHGIEDVGYIGEEMADIFIYAMDICNQVGIDLEKAFKDKYEILQHRIVRHRHSELVFHEEKDQHKPG